MEQHKLLAKATLNFVNEQFEKAVEINPGYVQALYDCACTSSLLGDAGAALDYLNKLRDIGTKDALRRVMHARVDKDFADLRNDRDFRETTGYVRVKIVNGVGEYGEDEVERISKTLRKLEHHVADVGVDKAERTRPIIWYKPEDRGARAAAYIFDKVLNHPQTKFNHIDWDSDADVIISWGDKIKFDEHGDPVVKSYAPSSPDDAEAKTDDLLFEQDKALREPEEYSRKVDKVVDTPDRLERRVEGGVRRTEKTLKTLEKTTDKVRGFFK